MEKKENRFVKVLMDSGGMTENRQNTIHWLRILFYIQLAGLILTLLRCMSMLTNISLGGSWTTWANRCVNLGIVVCLFLLPMHYRKAAVLKAVWFAWSLLSGLLPTLLFRMNQYEWFQAVGIVSTCVLFVLSFTAQFLEYGAHGTLCDGKTKRQWYILFICTLLVSVISQLAVYTQQDLINSLVQNGMTWVLTVCNLVSYLLTVVFRAFYLVLLRRTIQNVEKEE